jgi:hypothetical protein
MNIITRHEFPPVPCRDWDYSAIDSDTYDGPGSPLGEGPTKEAAIADLLEQLADDAP